MIESVSRSGDNHKPENRWDAPTIADRVIEFDKRKVEIVGIGVDNMVILSWVLPDGKVLEPPVGLLGTAWKCLLILLARLLDLRIST